MEDQDKIIPMKITLAYQDGSVEEKTIGGIFEAENGNKYAVLYDDKTITEGFIEFVKLTPFKTEDGDEDFLIESLESEKEYEIVLKAFNATVTDAFANYTTDENTSPDTNDSEYVFSEEPVKFLDGEEIFLTDENGDRVRWILIKVFDFQTQTYAVMRKNDEYELYIFHMIISDTPNTKFNNCRFDSIEDEKKYDEVQQYFLEKYSEEI